MTMFQASSSGRPADPHAAPRGQFSCPRPPITPTDLPTPTHMLRTTARSAAVWSC